MKQNGLSISHGSWVMGAHTGLPTSVDCLRFPINKQHGGSIVFNSLC